STIVHSNTIPPKEQPQVPVASLSSEGRPHVHDGACNNNPSSRDAERMISTGIVPPRTSQASQRISHGAGVAKPGKVVYENGSTTKDAYDPRRFIIRSAVLPPQNTLNPAFSGYSRQLVPKSQREEEVRTSNSSQQQQPRQHQHHMSNHKGPVSGDVTIDISTSNPFCFSRLTSNGKAADAGEDATAILQAKSQFNGMAAAAAAAASRQVGAVQYGMSRMY
ncbi:hypothetical protein AMTR_s00179p00011640, partial [Amborella trichopoda]